MEQAVQLEVSEELPAFKCKYLHILLCKFQKHMHKCSKQQFILAL